MKTVPVIPGMFCWHELVTARTADAAQFYSGLFGGEVQSFPLPIGLYSILMREGQPVAGFQPCNDKVPMDAPHQWLNYLAVADVDATVRAALELGGSVCMPPEDNSMGRAAIIRDPLGARVALFKAEPGKTDGTNPAGDGCVCWVELYTEDPAGMARFYGKLLGWTTTVFPLPSGDVHVARVQGRPVATICQRAKQDPMAFNRWYPFFQVESVESAGKRARALGGRLATEPMDVPGVGRVVPVFDAVGAELAFMCWAADTTTVH